MEKKILKNYSSQTETNTDILIYSVGSEDDAVLMLLQECEQRTQGTTNKLCRSDRSDSFKRVAHFIEPIYGADNIRKSKFDHPGAEM